MVEGIDNHPKWYFGICGIWYKTWIPKESTTNLRNGRRKMMAEFEPKQLTSLVHGIANLALPGNRVFSLAGLKV